MTQPVGLAPIPWRFVDTDLMKMWLWETEHFEAKVAAEGTLFVWEVGDLIVSNQGLPRFLAEGRTGDFASAERECRELIGKSYSPRLGYARYAGHLATTFTLASGERRDLAPFHGQRAVVTVQLPTGDTQGFVGQVQISHYELILTPDAGTTVRIQPPHIVQIVGETGGTGRSAGQSAYTGSGRIYRGQVTRGCTGNPGFMANTIDHTGPAACPVHEDNAHGFKPVSRVRPVG